MKARVLQLRLFANATMAIKIWESGQDDIKQKKPLLFIMEDKKE